jgi:hypothetical protein
MFAIKPSRKHRKIRLIELYLCAQEINWNCSGIRIDVFVMLAAMDGITGARAPRLHSTYSLQPSSSRQELRLGAEVLFGKEFKLGRSQYPAWSPSSTPATRTSEMFPSPSAPIRLPRPLHKIPGDVLHLLHLSMVSLPLSVAPPAVTAVFPPQVLVVGVSRSFSYSKPGVFRLAASRGSERGLSLGPSRPPSSTLLVAPVWRVSVRLHRGRHHSSHPVFSFVRLRRSLLFG